MHKILKGFCVIGVLLLAAIPTFAQDATQVFVATPTPIPTTNSDPTFAATPRPGYWGGRNLWDVSIEMNVCPEDLIEANRAILSPEIVAEYTNPMMPLDWLWSQLPYGIDLFIPPHDDCYAVVKTDGLFNNDIEMKYNVCIEEFYQWMRFSDSDNMLYIYIRNDAPPCVNEAGQRLQYYASEQKLYDIPIYSDIPFVEGPADITQLGYCISDLVRANPAIYFNLPNPLDIGTISYVPGMRVFVPEGVRNCGSVSAASGTLYEISQQKNICMETLLATTGVKLVPFYPDYNITFQFPLNAGPCYDETGQRIGFKDRTVYTPQQGESFLDIARAHDVCLDDLWDANPVMDAWDGWTYTLPPVVFIPDTAPCTQQQYTVHDDQTLHSVSLLTNVCINRLADANPAIDGAWLNTIPDGTTLTMPQRPHCYDFSNAEGGLKLQPHICYSVPVTAESDFTGRKPALSASLNTDLPYCYDRVNGMTVFHNNEPYTLYQMHAYETFITVSQCFGLKLEELLTLNLYDSFNSGWSVSPAVYYPYQGPLLVPQPHADCALLGLDDAAHRAQYVQMTYKAGSLQEGVYTVNYNDTLSSIGRKYGYLPQSIADANDLADPTMILYMQELKMPSYPSLYTLAPVGGAAGSLVLAGGFFVGLRRWSRARGKSKKKNS